MNLNIDRYSSALSLISTKKSAVCNKDADFLKEIINSVIFVFM